MSGFGCWIQPRPATILTFLPVFDSTTASILEKFDLSSWKTVSSSPRITANQCFFPLESSAIGDSSMPVFQRRCLDCSYSISVISA